MELTRCSVPDPVNGKPNYYFDDFQKKPSRDCRRPAQRYPDDDHRIVTDGVTFRLRILLRASDVSSAVRLIIELGFAVRATCCPRARFKIVFDSRKFD